jgi:fluoride exporter
MFQSFLLVFFGGGLGSLARYSVSLGLKQVPEAIFPWATLISNVASCLIMALIISMLGNKLSDQVRLFALIGFCGGFSTFSTFSFETLEIFRRGEIVMGILNILVSLALCLLVFASLVRK